MATLPAVSQMLPVMPERHNDADLKELKAQEKVIADNMGSLFEIGAALKTIRDKKLYWLCCESFKEYVKLRWPTKLSRQHAYNLITSKEVIDSVEGLVVRIDSPADKPALKTKGRKKSTTPQVSQNRVKDLDTVSPHKADIKVSQHDGLALNVEQALALAKIPTESERANVLSAAIKKAKLLPSGVLNLTTAAIRKAHKEVSGKSKTDDEEDILEEGSTENEMKAWNAKVENLCQAIKKAFAENTPEGYWLKDQDCIGAAESELEAVCTTLRSAKCDICPRCDGNRCESCHELGYLPKFKAKVVAGYGTKP